MQKFPTSFGSGPQYLQGDVFNNSVLYVDKTGYVMFIDGIFTIAILVTVSPLDVTEVF